MIETKISKNYFKEIIIGVGININQRIFLLKDMNQLLLFITLKKINRKIFLDSFIVKFNIFYDLFLSKDYEYLQSNLKSI